MYCACIICNTIILLNLLIALMGDTYDRVQESAVTQGRYEQVHMSVTQSCPPPLPVYLAEPSWLVVTGAVDPGD
jgi:hypothetical protein